MTRVIDALSPEQTQTLDHWSDSLQGLVNSLVSQGGPAARRFKNWLNGVWLGHPLHPALTDATIGAWTTGSLLDLVGATREADAAMTVGVLTAVPTALAGAADWADTSEQPRRLGLVHALLNSGGLVLMIASLFARRTDRRVLGIGLSTLGLSLTSISAWLGGVRQEVETGVSIGIQARIEELLSLIDEHLGQGYRRIKIKIEPGQNLDGMMALAQYEKQVASEGH